MGPKAEAIGSRSAKPIEVPTTHDRPHGKSPISESSFEFVHTVNTTSSTSL